MLTDTKIKQTKPAEKPIKLADGGGLYLEVSPSGGKLWRYRYRLDGKESMMSLGDYPRVSLAEARRARDDAREIVKSGMNPALARQQAKAAKRFENANTFEAVAWEWYADKSPPWSTTYAGHVKTILEKDVLPKIGKLPIKTITTPMVHTILKRIEGRQAPTRAILARQIIGGICKLAILTHRAEHNIAEPLKGEIARCVVVHRKHLKRADLPDFLRRLEDYTGHITTTIALKLLLLTAVRPGELCGAAWKEFEFESGLWRIPAQRMKMKEEHLVPLSKQALALLDQLKEQTGQSEYLFPTQGTKSKVMPTATLRNAVSKLGYGDKFDPHGARGTFSSICNEAGYRPDVIERQLAHGERDKVRAAYNQAEYWPERMAMMQDYANLLEALLVGGKVIPFGKIAA